VAHRQERAGIETGSEKLTGTIDKRLLGTADDDLAGAFETGGEAAGLAVEGNDDQAFHDGFF
jgi:hypothetical protein